MTDLPKAQAEQRKERLKWLAGFLGEPVEDVTLAEKVEPVIPEPKACGAGKGVDCCIFLCFGLNGFLCERHGPRDAQLRTRNQHGEMTSQREPEAPYPDCMET